MAKTTKTKKALYGSSGVFPGSTAINSVSGDDLRRLMYRTTSGTGVPGRVMSEEDKWDNFMDVHDIGKRDTKFMKFQKNVAPLLDHSACTNRRDFVELPVGDNIINKQLAEVNKNGLSSGGKNAVPVEFKPSSSYMDEFVHHGVDRMRGAKQTSTKPTAKMTATITGMTEMMETKSRSHQNFSTPNAELARAGEICLAPGNLGLSSGWSTGPPQSSYGKDFKRQSASTSQLMHMADLEGMRPSELLPDDDPCFGMRRACFLSPGQ